jgi:hypothetical protein
MALAIRFVPAQQLISQLIGMQTIVVFPNSAYPAEFPEEHLADPG